MNTNREVWQGAHGTIPKGWLVHNLNGDKNDNRLENLAAIPRNPDHVGQVTAPYIVRVRKLERELKLSMEK